MVSRGKTFKELLIKKIPRDLSRGNLFTAFTKLNF